MKLTNFKEESRKLVIGLVFFAALFGPIVIGGLIGGLLWGEIGMFLGAMTPPITAFALFAAWSIGDEYRS